VTGPIEVQFLNTITGSSQVRRRVFENETTYAQWLASVGTLVEVITVRPVVAR
jgi:hypothetical protein